MLLVPKENLVKLNIPLFLELCPAGFPSPAQDYTSSELDLNDYCIRHPSATYFVRAQGTACRMWGCGMEICWWSTVHYALRTETL